MYDLSGGENDNFDKCKWPICIAVLITIMVIYMCKNCETLMGGKKVDHATGVWLGSTPQKQILTGPMGNDVANNQLPTMAPYQLTSYTNTMYPPSTTSFKTGSDGITQCAVSSVNNAPSDLYYKCNNKTWSKEAIGEAIALSSVGSYYSPSGVEEESLSQVVALGHSPTVAACANAGGVAPYVNPRPTA